MGNGISTVATSAWELPETLDLVSDIERLKKIITEWTDQCEKEVREIVRRQMSARAKYFRPVTIFACHRSVSEQDPPRSLMSSAAALELIHNVSLIIDDILDRSRFRRGNLSLHCRFGFLPALMTAGYINCSAFKLVSTDGYSVRLLAELMQRLGVAECLQWRLRRQPLGVEDWRQIAGEDTGVMFETCARLGTRDDRLRKFGYLLGTLYHGCDDVADVRGAMALGGGKKEDVVDGILTLPAAIATRDLNTALLFRNASLENAPEITEQLMLALPEAESYLDKIAAEAETEALANARLPERLIALVHHTRALSQA
ncbi:MAG: polyprenyl synthetase family protein [Pyrinomonadaceae bacterium]